MVNPFTDQSIQILKEAFPKVQESVIDDMLWSAKGNVNTAFEMLLSMTNGPSPVTYILGALFFFANISPSYRILLNRYQKHYLQYMF